MRGDHVLLLFRKLLLTLLGFTYLPEENQMTGQQKHKGIQCK